MKKVLLSILAASSLIANAQDYAGVLASYSFEAEHTTLGSATLTVDNLEGDANWDFTSINNSVTPSLVSGPNGSALQSFDGNNGTVKTTTFTESNIATSDTLVISFWLKATNQDFTSFPNATALNIFQLKDASATTFCRLYMNSSGML